MHRGIIVPPSQPPYYSQGRGPCAFTCRGGKLAVPTPHTGPALLFIWQEESWAVALLFYGPYPYYFMGGRVGGALLSIG